MKPYQKRVLQERSDLNFKLQKLRMALAGAIPAIPEDEVERLRRQARAMQSYLDILDERIAHF